MVPTTSFAVPLTRLTLRMPGYMTTPLPLATTLVPSTTNAPCVSAPFFPSRSSVLQSPPVQSRRQPSSPTPTIPVEE